jgi:hypothetical protein
MDMWLLLVGCGSIDAVDIDTDTAIAAEDTKFLGWCDGWDTIRADSVTALDVESDEVKAVANLGIRLARPHRPLGHVFAMNAVDDGQGGRDWTLPDEVILAGQAEGMRVVPTLYPVAYLGDPAEGPQKLPAVALPEDVVGWTEFVRDIVERYDGDGLDDMPGLTQPVYAWEVGNEAFCAPGDSACVPAVSDFVITTAEAIRSSDPDAVVLGPGAPPLEATDQGFHLPVYEALLHSPAASQIDALALHLPPGVDGFPLADQVAWWRTQTSVDLWLGEIAARGLPGQPRVAPTEAGEAAWLEGRLTEARDLGLEHAFWCRTQNEIPDMPATANVLRKMATYEAN